MHLFDDSGVIMLLKPQYFESTISDEVPATFPNFI